MEQREKKMLFFRGERREEGEKFVIHVSLYLPTYLELSAIITTIPIIITTIQMANHTTQQKRTPLCNPFARRRRVIIAEKPWIDDDMPGMRSVRTDWGENRPTQQFCEILNVVKLLKET